MISVRRRLGVLLLAVAATMFSLMLLSASSGAQTSGLDPAEEECDVVGTGGSGVQRSSPNGNEDNSDQQTQDPSETNLRQPQQNEDEGAQQVQDEGDQRAQDQSAIDEVLAQNETEDGDLQQAQQDEDGDTVAPQDGESASPASDAEENAADECDVIADTVPDELLPPTGVPAESRTGDTAAEKERKPKPGEKKPNGAKKKAIGDENKPDEDKKPGSPGKPDRGEKLEVGQGSGKEPGREKTEARSESATAQKRVPGRSLSPRKKKVTSDDELRSSAPGSRRENNSETFARPTSAPDLAPVLARDWPRPSREEITAAGKPRRFAPDSDAEMTLSARALGVYEVPVASSDRLEDLDKGLVRMPKSSLPWDRGEQRNVYIAGHYLGHPESPSRLVFYNLDKLKKGDELVLKDGQGQPYKYRVSEKLEVEPEDSWVMGRVRNRDMVTLQTCIPPDFGKRLLVRADRV